MNQQLIMLICFLGWKYADHVGLINSLRLPALESLGQMHDHYISPDYMQ
jgi:hypothetical protein